MTRKQWDEPIRIIKLLETKSPDRMIETSVYIEFINVYPEWESNPHVLGHTPLKRARLPIPPPG